MPDNSFLLAGDIGGTKTNLAVFSFEKGWREPLMEQTFPSGQYPSLEALVQAFLAQQHFPIKRASFGVAGPVVGGVATITNLPWIIDEKQISLALNIPSVRLLNDLDAIAHVVPFLKPEELHTLNAGQAVVGGAIAVIAPGTGLGEAFLTWEGSRYQAHTSEGGHADFAPTNDLEIGLLRFVQQRFRHVSIERVCSGKGIPNIYAYLKEAGYAQEPPWLAKQLVGVKDPVPLIMHAALGGDGETPCDLCIATLDAFVSILGAEAGNLALKVLATGGVYLGGGIPPRILPYLEDEHFLQAFQRKGRLTDLLAHIPVHVILNPNSALLGAACHGLEAKH